MNKPEAREFRDTTAVAYGFCAPGFERVRDAFVSNLEMGDDLGASVAVYRYGQLAVDLFGGMTDDNGAYPSNAMHVLYSVTKGVTTLCLMLLADRGDIELDRAVPDYWPEFAQNGKGDVTVRQLLSHQAGLSGFSTPVEIGDFDDWNRIAGLLAAQSPLWQPGAAHGYHALNFGFLAGELVRRISGKSVGRLLQDEFSGPMGLDLFIGLPQEMQGRVVRLIDSAANPALGRALSSAASDPGSLTFNAFNNPPIDTEIFNDPKVWALEIPGANGVGTARSLAAVYSTVIDGPLRRISPVVVEDFRRECVFGDDLILTEQPTRFGAGFMLPSPREPMLSMNSFGHNGRGGALAFADPESGIAFAYLGNRLIHDPTPHSRLWRLLSALREAL